MLSVTLLGRQAKILGTPGALASVLQNEGMGEKVSVLYGHVQKLVRQIRAEMVRTSPLTSIR